MVSLEELTKAKFVQCQSWFSLCHEQVFTLKTAYCMYVQGYGNFLGNWELKID